MTERTINEWTNERMMNVWIWMYSPYSRGYYRDINNAIRSTMYGLLYRSFFQSSCAFILAIRHCSHVTCHVSIISIGTRVIKLKRHVNLWLRIKVRHPASRGGSCPQGSLHNMCAYLLFLHKNTSRHCILTLALHHTTKYLVSIASRHLLSSVLFLF